MIEDDGYTPLLELCLEKQAQTNNQLAENQNEEIGLNEDMAEQGNQLVEEQEEEKVICFSSFSFSFSYSACFLKLYP